MFEDVVTRVTFGSLEEAYMKRIKQGTPVQWEQETAQNHFVFLNSLQKKLGWSEMRHLALNGDGVVTTQLPGSVNHTLCGPLYSTESSSCTDLELSLCPARKH